MGIFSRLWDKVTDWLWDRVFTPFKNFVLFLIEEITVALRIFRHNLNQKMAEWLSNDAFFLLFVASIVTVVVFSGQIKEFLKNAKFYQWMQVIVAKLKDGTITLKKLNLIIDLKLLHTVSKVFFENYREVMQAFSEAVSQLCAELGEGSGYLHAYFASLRGLKLGTAAILNLDLAAAEASWYEDTTQFLEKANDNFNKYARDPGAMYYDFLDWQIRNSYDTYRDAEQAEVDEIRDAHNRVTQVDNGLIQVNKNLEIFVDNLPGEIEAVFRDQIGPFQDEMIRISDIIHNEFLPMFTDLADAFEEHRKYQVLLNDKAVANMQRYDGIFSDPWNMDEMDRANVGGSYDYLMSEGTKDERAAFAQAVTMYGRDYDSITREYILSLGISPALRFEPKYAQGRPDLVISIPSPFVGDY